MAGDNSKTNKQFLPLTWTELTDEIRQRAERELNETDDRKKVCLKELKALIKNKKNLKADMCDEFLLRFLRARKFNTKAAFGVMKNHYSHRDRYPSIYHSFTASACVHVMRAHICNFLSLRNVDGSAVWLFRIGFWDPEAISFDELLKFGLLCQDTALLNPVTQICGITSVVDLKEMSWSHLLHLPLNKIRCFVSAIQDSYPIRHKAVHIINNSSLFSVIFTLMKPFLSPKMRKRIFFHGDNVASLHEFLDPSILPEDLGGTRDPFGNEQFYSSLMNENKEIERNKKYGFLTQDSTEKKPV